MIAMSDNGLQKSFTIRIPSHVYFKFMQRLHFYEISVKDFTVEMIEAFLNGELDDRFDIPQD